MYLSKGQRFLLFCVVGGFKTDQGQRLVCVLSLLMADGCYMMSPQVATVDGAVHVFVSSLESEVWWSGLSVSGVLVRMLGLYLVESC